MSNDAGNGQRGIATWASGSASTHSRCEDGPLTMPVILQAALEECGVPIKEFVAWVRQRSLWQDDAIRSLDGRLIIQAHLTPDGLRCVIQIGREAFYHYPANILHIFHVTLPATVMAVREIAATSIIEDPLLRAPGILISSIRLLRKCEPGIGITLLLVVASTSPQL